MIDTKYIISTAIVSGLFIVVTTMSSIAAAENNAAKRALGNSLVLAQAHEHDDDKGVDTDLKLTPHYS